jgi:hypothetical protein
MYLQNEFVCLSDIQNDFVNRRLAQLSAEQVGTQSSTLLQVVERASMPDILELSD